MKQEHGVGYKDVSELETLNASGAKAADVDVSRFDYGGRSLGVSSFKDKSIQIARGLDEEGKLVITRHEWKHTQQMWKSLRGLQEQLYTRSAFYRFGLESEAHAFAVLSPEAGSSYAWGVMRSDAAGVFNPMRYANKVITGQFATLSTGFEVELAGAAAIGYGGWKAKQALWPGDSK